MRSHYVTVNNLTLHYTVTGQGPPVVLVHGYAHAQTMWRRPVEHYLQKHFRCYALDLPGHGLSDTPPLAWFRIENFTATLRQFCLSLALENFILIGYSMGGLISLDLTLRYPDLVTNLVLINAPIHGRFLARFDPLLRLEKFIQHPIAEKLFRLYNRYYWLSIPVELNRYANPKLIFSESCRRIQLEMGQCHLQTLFGNYKAIRAFALRQKIAALRPPTLIITSDKDRVVPPGHARLIDEQISQAQLVVIPNCGHLPLDEQPDLFDAVLKQYLRLPEQAHEDN